MRRAAEGFRELQTCPSALPVKPTPPNQAFRKPSMVLEDFIRDAARHPTGQTPQTLQDVADRRINLDSHAATATRNDLFTPRIVWRLRWLSMRQVQLIPALLPLPRVVAACQDYTDALCESVGRLYRELPHDRPQPMILAQYFAESVDFWKVLSRQLNHLEIEPLHWIERDVEALLWIRLCTFYACATVTRSGRARSRREVSDILANALTDLATPNTIRLRIAPAIDRDLKTADRWAAFCAVREPLQSIPGRTDEEDPPIPARSMGLTGESRGPSASGAGARSTDGGARRSR
jgi:hypothetical protein